MAQITAIHENVDTNIWSYQFVFDVANAVGRPNRAGFARRPWKKSTEVHNKKEGHSLSADINREFIAINGRTMDNIQFTVQNPCAGGNTRYFFIMYDSFSGACLVDVVKVAEPCKTCDVKIMQNQTIHFRRVWTTMEASSRCDTEQDTQHGLLGSISLREKLKENMNEKKERYHVGDVVYEDGDIRDLIGIVKWYPDQYKDAADLPKAYFSAEYPKADCIRIGAHFSQTRGSLQTRRGAA